VDVAAAGELLVRGQAEELGHPLVPARAEWLWFDRERGGAQRDHLGPGPACRHSGRGPAPSQLAVQLLQGLTWSRVGFQLLLLQFAFQIRSGPWPGRLQHGSRDRLGPAGVRLDKQELLFHTHAARVHRQRLPADPRSMRDAD
jgi:hypothetical protein